MTINITEDIKSVTDLKKNAMLLMRQVHDTGRPVVLTVNGKAEAVLLDAKEYERMTEALAMMKLLLVAEEDVKQAKVRNVSAFFEEFHRGNEVSG
jgi:prevent-host-death family protein